MALTPESRPTWQSWGNLRPASEIQPQVGIYYDAAGTPHQAYIAAYQNAAGQAALAPGTVAPASFTTVVPSDTVAQRAGIQGLMFVTAQTALSVKGLADTVAVSLGAQAAGSILRGQFGFVMATGTAPGTGIVALI